MDSSSHDHSSWPAKLVTRVGRKFRSDKSFTQEAIKKNEERAAEQRRKRAERMGLVQKSADPSSSQQDVNELGEREYSISSQASTLLENKDHTDMMHGLTHRDSSDTLREPTLKDRLTDSYLGPKDLAAQVVDPLTLLHDLQFATLPSEVWKNIGSYLSPTDLACLTISTKTLGEKLGDESLILLNRPENRAYKGDFLYRLYDHQHPEHLLCFACARYHRRSNPRKESLKADFINNPLFDCPNTRTTFLPRMRLVHGRELPYSFVQLATRGARNTPGHGIPAESLGRQWKCKDSQWSHSTRYMINDGRLLMRVISKTFAPPNAEMSETKQRHLLYDREEYTPFFSVCAHWRDGDLMKVCKCALSHVPSPPVSYLQQFKTSPKLSRTATRPNFIVRGCDDCRPARRCPECPSEYLVEIQMAEDKNDPIRPFKHVIVVTRWSDLGDGSSPFSSPEWASIKGAGPDSIAESYKSFKKVGRRAVSGIFESRISGSVPGQRMISMNPKNERLGEEGHGWY